MVLAFRVGGGGLKNYSKTESLDLVTVFTVIRASKLSTQHNNKSTCWSPAKLPCLIRSQNCWKLLMVVMSMLYVSNSTSGLMNLDKAISQKKKEISSPTSKCYVPPRPWPNHFGWVGRTDGSCWPTPPCHSRTANKWEKI